MKRLTNIKYDENFEALIKPKREGCIEEFSVLTGGLITQTAALGVIRETIDDDAIVVGAAGSLPEIFKECGKQMLEIHTIWNMDIHVWDMK